MKITKILTGSRSQFEVYSLLRQSTLNSIHLIHVLNPPITTQLRCSAL